MAEDAENDDQWLYGDQPEINLGDSKAAPEIARDEPPVLEKSDTEPIPQATSFSTTTDDPGPPGVDENEQPDKEVNEENNDVEDGEAPENGADEDDLVDDDDDDDDSDDDVNVVIGDIKTTPSYTSLNIKRGGLLTTAQADKAKQSQQPGKFSVEEFDQSGTINGVPATEYNLDSLEEKPWRKPGADITDYFNYGFNEDTWRAYCERQKRMRLTESGVGLQAQMTAIPRGGTVPIMNDNSKYSGNFLGMRKAGPPPGRRMTGSIDVIGGTGQRPPPGPVGKLEPPKMNVIQVMTADRREYSRKPPNFPDMTVPPPSTFEEFQPEYGFNPEPEPFYGGYEPTQEAQWGADAGAPPPNWTPSDIKSLTPGPVPPPANVHMGPPPASVPLRSSSPKSSASPTRREDAKEVEKGRESVGRSRSERPRDRERSHRRERSRSRSRRHKSRSRSPSHRSHKKKKSRRHEDSD